MTKIISQKMVHFFELKNLNSTEFIEMWVESAFLQI